MCIIPVSSNQRVGPKYGMLSVRCIHDCQETKPALWTHLFETLRSIRYAVYAPVYGCMSMVKMQNSKKIKKIPELLIPVTPVAVLAALAALAPALVIPLF